MSRSQYEEGNGVHLLLRPCRPAPARALRIRIHACDGGRASRACTADSAPRCLGRHVSGKGASICDVVPCSVVALPTLGYRWARGPSKPCRGSSSAFLRVAVPCIGFVPSYLFPRRDASCPHSQRLTSARCPPCPRWHNVARDDGIIQYCRTAICRDDNSATAPAMV